MQFAIQLGVSLGFQLLGALLTPAVEVGKIKDKRLPSQEYGSDFSRVVGTMPVAATLIWLPQELTERKETHGKIGGKQIEYKYFADLAYAVAYGETLGLNRLKLNGDLKVDLLSSNADTLKDSRKFINQYLTYYQGEETQFRNPTMVSADGSNNTPAYRDLSYFVLDSLELTDYGNRPPTAEALVCTRGSKLFHSFTISGSRPSTLESLVPADVVIDNAPDDPLLYRMSRVSLASGASTGGAHGSLPMSFSAAGVEFAVRGTGQYGVTVGSPANYSDSFKYCVEVTSTSYRILRDGFQIYAPTVATPLNEGCRIRIKQPTLPTLGWGGIEIEGGGDPNANFDFYIDGVKVHSATGSLSEDEKGGDGWHIAVKLESGAVYCRDLYTDSYSAQRIIPDPVPLRDLLTDLCSSRGVDVDVSDIPAEAQILGLLLDGSGSVVDWIEQLRQLYFFDYVQRGDQLVFRAADRGAPVRTLSERDLAAHERDTSRGVLFDLQVPDASQLPGEVRLKFYDGLDPDLREKTVYARIDTSPSKEKVDLSVNAALTPTQAQKLAEVFLRAKYLERTVSFNLTLEHADLEPGDVVRVPLYGVNKEVKLTKVTLGANLLLQCEAVFYEGSLWDTLELSPEFPAAPTFTAAVAANQYLALYEGKVRNSDPDPVLNWGVGGITEPWRVASLWASADGGDSYKVLGRVNDPSTVGETSTALPDVTDLDTTSVLKVQMNSGTLETITNGSFVAGGLTNLLLVGDEVLRFRDAVLIGDNTYEISYLKRGLRGTPTSGHKVNEPVVLLETLTAVALEPDAVGSTYLIKVLFDNQALDETVSISVSL